MIQEIIFTIMAIIIGSAPGAVIFFSCLDHLLRRKDKQETPVKLGFDW